MWGRTVWGQREKMFAAPGVQVDIIHQHLQRLGIKAKITMCQFNNSNRIFFFFFFVHEDDHARLLAFSIYCWRKNIWMVVISQWI